MVSSTPTRAKRAMVASAGTASVIAGNAMCRRLLTNWSQRPASSRIDQEEAGHAGVARRCSPRCGRAGQPFELHREKELQHDGEPERRHGESAHRDDAHDMVEQTVVVNGRQRAERDADQRRQQERDDDELERWRAAVRRTSSITGRFENTELPRSPDADLADIDGELLVERPVESRTCAGSPGPAEASRFRPRAWSAGSAGTTRTSTEGEHHQPEQGRDGQKQAADQEEEQRLRFSDKQNTS